MKRQRTRSSLHKYSLSFDNSHDDGWSREKLFRLEISWRIPVQQQQISIQWLKYAAQSFILLFQSFLSPFPFLFLLHILMNQFRCFSFHAESFCRVIHVNGQHEAWGRQHNLAHNVNSGFAFLCLPSSSELTSLMQPENFRKFFIREKHGKPLIRTLIH